MLRMQPEAVCDNDTSKGALVFLGERVREQTPFMGVDRDMRGGQFGAIAQIVVHVEGDCPPKGGRDRVVCNNDSGCIG